MEGKSLESVLGHLNAARVRYLVAGGLAVVAHGHVRFTQDLDLMIALDEENTRLTVEVLKALGYRPLVAAVTLDDLADASKRRSWVEEKSARTTPARRPLTAPM